jgi:hypothetical protein
VLAAHQQRTCGRSVRPAPRWRITRIVARHLEALAPASRITTIPYGANPIVDAPVEPVHALGLEPGRYVTLIARRSPRTGSWRPCGPSRPVRGHSSWPCSGATTRIRPTTAVRAAAGTQVRFLGHLPIAGVVQALRRHAVAHVHGHRVGGTNPSLVEALGAGNAVLADDNRFNRWVAGAGVLYYADEAAFDALLRRLEAEPAVLDRLRQAARERFSQAFDWPRILSACEDLLTRFVPASRAGDEPCAALSRLQAASLRHAPGHVVAADPHERLPASAFRPGSTALKDRQQVILEQTRHAEMEPGADGVRPRRPPASQRGLM